MRKALSFCLNELSEKSRAVAKLRFERNCTLLEIAEKLEQLTFLANGFDIHVEIARAATGLGVDTESDLKKVKKEFKK